MVKFSQVFLKDEAMRKRIASHVLAIADFSLSENALVEIGPGRGAITSLILPHVPSMKAVEIDSRLAAQLKKDFPNLDILNMDFLKTSRRDLFPEASRLFFFGNLPYRISTAIMEKILDMPDFSGAVFMFQKEVADRLVASAGDPDYGYFSAVCALQSKIKKLLFVPRGCFNPVPKVDSSVVLIEPVNPAPDAEFILRYRQTVSMCFAHRRKTLPNSISIASGGTINRERAAEIICRAGIDPSLRAERLGVEEFRALTEAFRREGLEKGK